MSKSDPALHRLAGSADKLAPGGDGPQVVVVVDGLSIEGTLTHAGVWESHVHSILPDAVDSRQIVGSEGDKRESSGVGFTAKYLYIKDSKAMTSEPVRIPVDRISAWTVLSSGPNGDGPGVW